VFALIELLRGVTAFLVAPILLYLVADVWTDTTSGIQAAIGICLGLALTGFVLAYGLYVFGKVGLQTPDIDRWQEEGEPAWSSPRLLAHLRPAPSPPGAGAGSPNGHEQSRSVHGVGAEVVDIHRV
jgi:hypothetical protein